MFKQCFFNTIKSNQIYIQAQIDQQNTQMTKRERDNVYTYENKKLILKNIRDYFVKKNKES